jgi:hypothetical protein
MRGVVESYMDDILRLFVAGTKITVVIRPPSGDESDVLLTNDSLDEVSAAVERAKVREDV